MPVAARYAIHVSAVVSLVTRVTPAERYHKPFTACVLVRACVLASVRACVLASVRACVLASVRACVLASVRACVLASVLAY